MERIIPTSDVLYMYIVMPILTQNWHLHVHVRTGVVITELSFYFEA